MRILSVSQIFLPLAAVVALGCGQAEIMDYSNLDSRPDGAAKDQAAKADHWNASNNPDRFQVELEYRLDALPTSGRSEHIPWPADYWPTYKDSINKRWQGADSLSPAEKYDAVFNGWDTARVEDLRPFNPSDCEMAADGTAPFDEAYYENLGPAANYVSTNKGNRDTREAVLDGELNKSCSAKDDSTCIESCGEEDSEGYDRCEKRCDRGGVETWWGLCHAWAPAAVLEAEPLHAVEHNGTIFEVSDIKALLIAQYDRPQAYMIGGRCNAFEVKRDDTGRVTNEECRDTNAGTYHVVMANFLGKMNRPLLEDRTYDYEVWNQPIIEWKVNSMEEITEAQAIEAVQAPEGTEKYPYNDAAVRWYRVNATSYYITESNPSTVAYTDTISTYTRTDVYDYVLEIDADGNIHGGEWLGASRQAHPDFLWLPTATRGGNPHIDLANIHMLLEKSRAPELPAGETQPETDVSVYENEFSFDIPDNDATGVTSVITVHDTLTTSTFEVEVDIEHTFIGDLKVIVRKDGQESILHNKAGGSSDNIQRVFRVTDMSGIEASGNWELIIVDSAGQDTGRLISWKLKFGGAAETTSTESGSFTATSSDEVAIPDNDPAGAASVLTVADSRGIEALKVSINVRHSYVGALTVELSHGAIKHILHNSEGGSDNSIVKTYDVTAFNGDNSDGEWTLKVIDNDAYGDTGAIESWSLEFLY